MKIFLISEFADDLFPWSKKEEKTEEKVRSFAQDLRFYLEYIPKFFLDFIKSYKELWKIFLRYEIEKLQIELYAEKNKNLNKRFGVFDRDNSPMAGVQKAMEITPMLASHILKDEKNFQQHIDARVEPFKHHMENGPVAEEEKRKEKFEEKAKEYEGKGLGEIVGFMEDDKDDGRDKKE